jgi:hypothetical protein
MTANQNYHRTTYLNAIKDHVTELYGVQDSKSEPYMRLKNRLDGFIHAGLVIGIASNAEIKDIVEKVHMNVFGMTIKQRGVELKLGSKAAEVNWDLYDTPTIHRK